MPVPRPDPERERLDSIIRTAKVLAPELDLKRFPDAHIHRALDQAGVKDLPGRKRLIPSIKKALHQPPPTPFSGRPDLIEDARVQERRHPHDDEDGA